MNAHERFDEDVAAYALDMLDASARTAFEVHLADCEICQASLARLRAVSAGIALAREPETPPASLRARTLARATAQPQARPAPVAGRIMPKPAPLNPRPTVSSASWLLLAASLVALVGLGAYAWTLRTELAAAHETLADMSARVETMRGQLASARLDAARLVNSLNVLRSADVIRIDLRGLGPAPEASGHAYLSATRGIVFDAEHMPPIGTARTYQLWVVPPGANVVPISAGTFDVERNGSSTVALPLPSGVRVVAAVAVTEEPAGGSIKATTAPLLLGTARN